jgi:trehalose 6-phosphate phosphatase
VGTPRELRGDEDDEEREEPPERRDDDSELDTDDRCEADDPGGPPAHVAVEMLPPGSGHDDRKNREERRRLGVHLAEIEQQNERRHEDQSSADAEETAERSRDEADRDRSDDLHLDDQPDGYRREQDRERVAEHRAGDTLLKGGPADCSHRGREPQQEAVAEVDIAPEGVGNRADRGDQPDRGERRGHRRSLLEPDDEDEQRDDDDPAADPEQCAEEACDETDPYEPHSRIVRGVSALDRLAEAPELAAIALDIDGTLAPIVRRPDEAAVPEAARRELGRLVGRYALVACVSGRTGDEARRMVAVDGVRYVGSHGLELSPEADRWRDEIHRFTATVDWPVEDKGLTVTFHYREAENEEDALEYLREVADRAREAGLAPRFGRKVLEIRPPVHADKGTAVRQLLGEAGLKRALYAGDDTTDVDGFRALDGLELGVRVAVSSDEAPSELLEAADVVVESPAELLVLLGRL